MIVRYTSVATVVLAVYEYSITIDQEITLFWKSRLSVIKILFFLNRYSAIVTALIGTYVLILDIDYENCKRIFTVGGVLTCCAYIWAECILYVRAYAVWGGDRSVFAFLVTTLTAGTIGSYYVTAVFLRSTSSSDIHLFQSGCSLTFPDRIEWIALVILVCAETIALSLLLLKALVYYRDTTSSILIRMYRDGIPCYVAILASTIANLLVLCLASSILDSFLLIPQAVLHSIICSRLLMRIRGVYGATVVDGHQSPCFSTEDGPEEIIFA